MRLKILAALLAVSSLLSGCAVVHHHGPGGSVHFWGRGWAVSVPVVVAPVHWHRGRR